MSESIIPSRDPRRWWSLAALAAGGLVAGLDMTVLNVALPTLARELAASTSELQWFLNAYTLALAVGLLPAGALVDRWGAKRLLIGAFALFALASLACGGAGSPAALVVARVVLGVASAGMMTAAMAVLTIAFDVDERPKAMGTWIALNGLGLPLGPLLGGWLLDHVRWGWVFWINVPLALLAIVVATWSVAPSRPGRAVPLDWPGAIGSAVGLGLLTFGFIRAGEDGWDHVVPWAWIGAGTVVVLAVVLLERRTRHPLIDLTLFRQREFAWATVALTAGTITTMGLLFLLPQYLQSVRGFGAFRSGLELLPLIVGLAAGARVGPLLLRRGPRLTMGISFALFVAALVTGAVTKTDSSMNFVRAWELVGGLAFGIALPTSMSLATNSLGAAKAGAGNALLQALRQVGGTLGVAVLGSVLGQRYRDGLAVPAGLPAAAADTARRGIQGALAIAERAQLPTLATDARAAFTAAMGDTLLVSAAVAGVTLMFVCLVRPTPSPGARLGR